MTEEEKKQIRAEEIFRAEVRRELESASAPRSPSRLWLLLNSSFALWFLSSVVLAGLTTAVTYYQSKHTEHLRKAETERRLRTEIVSRVDLALRVIRLQQSSIANGNPLPAGDICGTAISYLDNSFGSSGPQDFSIYPEYKARNFRSLTFELNSVSDSPGLTNPNPIYEKLRDLGTELDEKREKATQQTIDAVIGLLNQLPHSRQ